jgi:uncharacterized protein YjbJ (UPF0337 family)
MEESSLQLQEPWDDVKEKLKEINTSLTDDDLTYQPGKEDELIQRLATKMKKKPDEIKALIESVSANRGKAS